MVVVCGVVRVLSQFSGFVYKQAYQKIVLWQGQPQSFLGYHERLAAKHVFEVV